MKPSSCPWRVLPGVLLLLTLLFGTPLGGQEVAGEAEEPAEAVLVYPIQGEINSSSMGRLQRDIDHYIEDRGVRWILFEVDSGGGELFSALDAADFLYRLDERGVRTYAYIPNGKWALSAAALLSLACGTLIMGDNTQIGDIEPIEQLTGRTLSEKIQSPLRAKVGFYAEQRHYPRLLAEAMVTKEMKVFRITRRDAQGNYQDDYVTSQQLEAMTSEEMNRIDRREVVVPEGQLLTMSEKEALEHGFITKIVTTRSSVLEQYGLLGPLIVHGEDPVAVPGSFRAATHSLWRFLNHPAVKFLLLILGVLGLAIELQVPGFGLPGSLGLLAFVIFFVAGIYDSPPTVGWVEVALFAGAVAFLAVEIFVIPGFGIFGLLGLGMLVTSLVLALMSGSGRFALDQLVESLFIVLLGLACSVGLVLVVLRFLPHSGTFASGLISTGVLDQGSTPETTDEQGARVPSPLIGREGIVVTALRPAGKIEVDGTLHDVIAEGGYLPSGKRVRVIRVEGHRIVVRDAEEG